MKQLVDKVARAIQRSGFPINDPHCADRAWQDEGNGERYREEFRVQARAAIAAVQANAGIVPKVATGEMLEASRLQAGESDAMRERYHARMQRHHAKMLAASPYTIF